MVSFDLIMIWEINCTLWRDFLMFTGVVIFLILLSVIFISKSQFILSKPDQPGWVIGPEKGLIDIRYIFFILRI